MLPCVTSEQVSLFGFMWPTQGVLAFAGAVVGHGIFVHRAHRHGQLSRVQAELAGIVGLLAAVTGGHLLAVLQQPELPAASWGGVVRLQASLGALGGGALALVALTRRWRRSPATLLDTGALAFAWGWPLVRLGCALVHDHLGRLSEGPLSVAFATGGRYDLGVLEWLASLPLLAAALWLARRGPPAGVLAAAFGLAFVAIRLPLEVLRVQAPAGLGNRDSLLNLLALAVVVGVAAALLRRARGQSWRGHGTRAES